MVLMSDKNKNRKKKQSLRIYEVPSYLKYFYLLKRNTFYKNKHVLLMKIHIHKSVLCTYNQEHLVIRSVSKAIYLLESTIYQEISFSFNTKQMSSSPQNSYSQNSYFCPCKRMHCNSIISCS